MADFETSVNFVVALMAEAKPLIEEFKLSPCPNFKGFRIYTRGEINLIISGIGRNNAAAASAYLAAIEEPKKLEPVWLNVGIAGHRSRAVGEVVVATKVVERESGHIFYPTYYPLSVPSSVLTTVDLPETDFSIDSAFDMEASGIATIATKFAPIEFIQFVKVISDNRDNSTEDLSKLGVYSLMRNSIDTILALIEAMQGSIEQRHAQVYLPQSFYTLIDSMGFSATEQVQLKRLCQRFAALGVEAQLDEIVEKNPKDKKALLLRLKSHLEQLALLTESS